MSLFLNGFGVKLRHEHYQEILTDPPRVDWFEILSEDYLNVGGNNRYYLEQISQHFPIAMHGVSLSLGGCDSLDLNYLAELKQLSHDIRAMHISDHLCWTTRNQINSHDLLPMPYTADAVKHISQRIRQTQDFLEQTILVENVSGYLNYTSSELSEWEFINVILAESNCLLLLDINNVYVNSVNYDFDPLEYIRGLDLSKVAQIHLAGHTQQGKYLIDTHDAPVTQAVWQLYQDTLQLLGRVPPVLLERDDNIPSLSELVIELDIARNLSHG